MPQFDTSFFASQIFWTIVSFVILFVVLSKWILPRIVAILNERTRLIEAEIEAAHKKHEEAEQLKSEYNHMIEEIDAETKKMFDESEKRLTEDRDRMMSEWNTEMERKKRQFLEDAEVTRQQAIRDIREQSAELITAAAEQIIHERLSEKEARKALEDSIAELEKHKNN